MPYVFIFMSKGFIFATTLPSDLIKGCYLSFAWGRGGVVLSKKTVNRKRFADVKLRYKMLAVNTGGILERLVTVSTEYLCEFLLVCNHNTNTAFNYCVHHGTEI